MIAEIIAVGTEILLGQVVNTNATYLSRQLASLGIRVYHHTVVGDNPSRLKDAIRTAEERSDLIILSGGLGPTKDDITKQVVSEHLGIPLTMDRETEERIIVYHENSKKTMPENNQLQALVLQDSTVLKNPTGLAAGMFMKTNDHFYMLLPGPPNELEPMFNEEAKPVILNYLEDKDVLISRFLRFFGIGESQLVTDLDDLIEAQANPTIASYAGDNEVTIRLTANGSTEEECEQLLDETEETIQKRLGEFMYGYGEEVRLQDVVSDLLKERDMKITAAESLTGGEFLSSITSVIGAGNTLGGGMVTYSNEVKKNVLGVSAETVDQFGVVSAECAIEMAERAQEIFQADIAVSFTGVAGPATMEGNLPGTVWIGLAMKGEPTFAKYYHFGRKRNSNRRRTVLTGLDLVRRKLLELPIEDKVLKEK